MDSVLNFWPTLYDGGRVGKGFVCLRSLAENKRCQQKDASLPVLTDLDNQLE